MIYGGTRGYVFCVDPRDGSEVWRAKLSTGGLFNAAAMGDVAVLVHDGIVVAGCNGHVWGIDAGDGSIRWHNGLSGLGNSFVTLADGAASVQYLHRHTQSSSST